MRKDLETEQQIFFRVANVFFKHSFQTSKLCIPEPSGSRLTATMASLVAHLPSTINYAALAAVAGIFTVIFVLHRAVSSSATYPKDLPLVGEPVGRRRFSLRTRWRYYSDCVSLYKEAYHNYSKKGKVVLVPGFGFGMEIILPESCLQWAQGQPNDVLSVTQAFIEINQTQYSLGHTRYWGDGWQFTLVKTQLSSVLQSLIPALDEELQHAFDKHFGTNSQSWTEVPLEKTLRKIAAQASSRFTVGYPLCRNDEYLDLTYRIIDGLMLGAIFGNSAPRMLRWLVGRLVGWNTHRNIDKIKKYFRPLYQERLEGLKYEKDDPAHPEPRDHVQMMMRFAEKKRPRELVDFDIMTKRLCAANFVSIHQTTITVTNMLLNIIGSDAEFNTITILRDEVIRVLGSDEAGWTKEKFAQMTKTDSVSRETMRLNLFGNRTMMRKVMKDGVVTDDGIKLPKGSIFSFLAQPAQCDEEKFADPLKFDPFRFSRQREASTQAEENAADGLTFVSTGPEYLPFGHGKHSCPGRFMVDYELKMIVAYVLMNYDIDFPIDYAGKRPAHVWLLEVGIPPPGARIRFKRRAQEFAA
ncbi:hypothetical protein ONS95_011580 [Cadophora gregata]|uniref:uncharacterized protein n=1 Tax=Cadophora gregata TaxID=51156 RepID=UPI0026DCFFB6|nr:uncharacterized protein ONS95_011580 [Cadophora gregata]KAK0120174.1 hypothetical protein ONS95_011580 [Cadophora gregata]KAK0121202.1 hypothetical protein ONS96_011381 [Cadophora gregata f. sp. sojae]